MYRRSRKQRARIEKLQGWAAAADAAGQPFTSGDVAGLQKRLQGNVVLPGDSGYDHARQQSNNAFQEFPLLIAYCEVFQDVHECLRFARAHDLWVSTRSGGHSTAGFSVNGGMAIDVSRMSYAVVEPERKRVVVGPGTNFEHLNATLDYYKLHVPTGGCGDVCVAGFMQGGGYGFTSRQFGMNCDNVLEVLVMLADGRVVKASARQNADLFWAVRGGTGGNFGIVLQVVYQLHELPLLWGFGLKWPIARAPAALVALQKGYMRRGAPPELGYMGIIGYQTDPKSGRPEPVLLMRGVYPGPRAEGMRLLEPLLKDTGAVLDVDMTGSYFQLNNVLLETPEPIPNCPDLAREDKQSAYIARELTETDWKRVCEHFCRSPNSWSTIGIEPYGGRINEVPRDASAFIHRDVDMDLFLDVFWMNEREHREVEAYLDGFMAMLRAYDNGHSYQNYPRRSQTDYRERFWGDAFERLLGVKRKYDPENFFHYEQSISPGGGESWPAVDTETASIAHEAYGAGIERTDRQ